MNLSVLAAMALTAIVSENYVFVRMLGIYPLLHGSKKVSAAACMGLTVTAVMTLAAVLAWPINRFLLAPLGLDVLQTLIFLPMVAALVLGLELLLKRIAPALHAVTVVYLPLVTANCAVPAVLFIAARQGYGFAASVIYSVLAGLGFTLAAVLLSGLRTQLERANPPKAFEGFPIVLITAGLIAMVFMGFAGVQVG